MVPINKKPKRYISNLFAQIGYGHHGQWTNYAALEESLIMLKKAMNQYNLTTFSIPYKMSCGLGGGDWDKVMEIIHKVFDETDFTLEIWELK
jgi:O-acetyl-ADP-ribose deacetylase (regulator of RNase III)